MKRVVVRVAGYEERVLMRPHVEAYLFTIQAFRPEPDLLFDPLTWEWYRLAPEHGQESDVVGTSTGGEEPAKA